MHSFTYGHLPSEGPGVRCPVKKVFDQRLPDSEPTPRTVFGTLAAMFGTVPGMGGAGGHGTGPFDLPLCSCAVQRVMVVPAALPRG
ncbi:hypothetical protein ACFU9X_33190, partial [Streptomyces atratus]